MSSHFAFRKLILITLLLAISGSLLIVHAGLRGRGRYSGVVIFDRWDTCLLLSGDYITYVSDEVKEHLRPYRNQAIQVDAFEISQPINPGDALIRRYTIIGPTPVVAGGQAIEGVRITAKSDLDRDCASAFLITIENSADSPIQIDSSVIGPTILGLKAADRFNPSDGNSMAWVTRGNLLTPSSRSHTVDNYVMVSAVIASIRIVNYQNVST